VLLYAPFLGTKSKPITHKEIDMSEALQKVRPVVEATVVSLALVIAALAVPVVILYAAV
jgi:hypothetical protein